MSLISPTITLVHLRLRTPIRVRKRPMQKDSADKPKVMAKQKELLADRYSMEYRMQSGITMTKGKPQPIGDRLLK